MARPIAEEEKRYAKELLQRARCAMRAIEHYDQAKIDRLCQAVAWAKANEATFTRLALRQKSMGVIEEIQEKGIVKYAKPAGVIAAFTEARQWNFCI
jgi:sulfoacetaldehyde dehydrogenase